jgi:hypothetical protein
MSVEITERRITPEEIKKLVEKANEIETKYLLILKREERTSGCGWKYLYEDSIEIVYGKGELVTLELSRPEECLWREKILVIPYTVPVVVVLKHRDQNPQISDYDEFFIFTPDGWKHLEVEVPK